MVSKYFFTVILGLSIHFIVLFTILVVFANKGRVYLVQLLRSLQSLSVVFPDWLWIPLATPVSLCTRDYLAYQLFCQWLILLGEMLLLTNLQCNNITISDDIGLGVWISGCDHLDVRPYILLDNYCDGYC